MENLRIANISHENQLDNIHEEWFSNFINEINDHIIADKKELESGDASKAKREYYNSLITGDFVKTLSIMRNDTSSLLIKNIVVNYLNKLKEHNIFPLKLAFDLSNNKILVWAEINEDDESAELSLIKVESIINGEFFDKTKIYLDSIIVETSDHLTVPPHYKLITH